MNGRAPRGVEMKGDGGGGALLIRRLLGGIEMLVRLGAERRVQIPVGRDGSGRGRGPASILHVGAAMCPQPRASMQSGVPS